MTEYLPPYMPRPIGTYRHILRAGSICGQPLVRITFPCSRMKTGRRRGLLHDGIPVSAYIRIFVIYAPH